MAATPATAAFFGGAVSQAYTKYRPTYPPEVYDRIVAFADAGAGAGAGGAAAAPRELAIDIACGTGQATVALADRYTRVVGVDGQATQLEHATQHPNVEYAHGAAEATGLLGGAANLVTVAQALHWFDPLDAFYREARRLLKPSPSGALAVISYALPVLGDADHPANIALLDAFHGLDPWWPPQRKLVDDRYPGLDPGSQHFRVVERQELEATQQLSIEGVLGYVTSWSAFAECQRAQPGEDGKGGGAEVAAAILEKLRAALVAAAGGGEQGAAAALFTVRLPILLILARDPVPL